MRSTPSLSPVNLITVDPLRVGSGLLYFLKLKAPIFVRIGNCIDKGVCLQLDKHHKEDKPRDSEKADKSDLILTSLGDGI